MNTVVFEHVKVTELPDAWRKKLSVAADAHVTVRIEDETTPVGIAVANASPGHGAVIVHVVESRAPAKV